MSRLLGLTAEFFERVMNPAYGIAVNDDYGIRLLGMLKDEVFEESLKQEAKEVKDTRVLTAHGWLWLLSWARSVDTTLDPDLLLGLAVETGSILLQVQAIDLATRDAEVRRSRGTPSVVEFRHEWLRKLLMKCVAESAAKDISDEVAGKYKSRDYTRLAESILIALLQVGNDACIEAASALVNHNWSGHQQVRDFLAERAKEADGETRRQWMSKLRIRPGRSPGEDHGLSSDKL
jgi:hypothetical protein